MKSCFSVLLTIIIVPVFFLSLLMTSLNNVFLSGDNYKQILSSSELDKNLIDYLTLSVKDNLISKSEDLSTLFDNTDGESAIKSFLENINAKEQFINSFSNIVNYIKEKDSSLNLSIKFSFTENQFENFKQNVISVISDGLLSLKKCDNNVPDQTNCRAPSLTTQDIVNRIKDVANNALNYTDLQSSFYAKAPISVSTKSKIDEVKSYYNTFNKINNILWVATIVIFILILLLSIYPEITIFSYISAAAFVTTFFIILTVLLFGYLWKRGYYLPPSQFGLSSDFSIDASNAIEDLFNNLFANLFHHMFINLIVIGVMLLVIGIISSILNRVIKRKDNDNYERKYTINAFSKKENSINEK